MSYGQQNFVNGLFFCYNFDEVADAGLTNPRERWAKATYRIRGGYQFGEDNYALLDNYLGIKLSDAFPDGTMGGVIRWSEVFYPAAPTIWNGSGWVPDPDFDSTPVPVYKSTGATLRFDGTAWKMESSLYDLPKPGGKGQWIVAGPRGRATVTAEIQYRGFQFQRTGYPAYAGNSGTLYLVESASGGYPGEEYDDPEKPDVPARVYDGSHGWEWQEPAWLGSSGDYALFPGGFQSFNELSADVPFSSEVLFGNPMPLSLRPGAKLFSNTSAYFERTLPGGLDALTLSLSGTKPIGDLDSAIDVAMGMFTDPDGEDRWDTGAVLGPGAVRIIGADGRAKQEMRFKLTFTIPFAFAASKSFNFTYEKVTYSAAENSATMEVVSVTASFDPGQTSKTDEDWRSISISAEGYCYLRNFKGPEDDMFFTGAPVLEITLPDADPAVAGSGLPGRFVPWGGSGASLPVMSVTNWDVQTGENYCLPCCPAIQQTCGVAGWSVSTGTVFSGGGLWKPRGGWEVGQKRTLYDAFYSEQAWPGEPDDPLYTQTAAIYFICCGGTGYTSERDENGFLIVDKSGVLGWSRETFDLKRSAGCGFGPSGEGDFHSCKLPPDGAGNDQGSVEAHCGGSGGAAIGRVYEQRQTEPEHGQGDGWEIAGGAVSYTDFMHGMLAFKEPGDLMETHPNGGNLVVRWFCDEETCQEGDEGLNPPHDGGGPSDPGGLETGSLF